VRSLISQKPMYVRASIRTLTFTAALTSVTLAGCHKQPKPQPIVPPPAFPQSAMSLPPVQPLPPPGVTAVPPPPPPDTSKTVRNNRPRPRPHAPEKRSPTEPSAPGSNGNGTVARSSPPRITTPSKLPDPAGVISPGMAHSDELHHRLSTAQLIQSTEDTLKSLTRTLSDDDKSVIEQIRNFLAQSRSATAENDLIRAHNLALKAHLLSDELVRP
jgi:hypothetical protein